MLQSMMDELRAQRHQEDLRQEAAVERSWRALQRDQQLARRRLGGTRPGPHLGHRLQMLAHALGHGLRPAHGHAAR